jgi:hypothetical protein
LLKKSVAILAGLILIVTIGGLALFVSQGPVSQALCNWTGEEEPLPQVKGVVQLLFDLTRRRTETRPYVPVAHAGLSPFGVNTFLEQEVEPEKRERTLQMVKAAGFRSIRQEFPWEDIEIHGKGDFEDRRHEPHRSAWEKYDHIVDLAEKYDLGIIARLSNPPAWSRAAGNDVGPLAPPDDYADYGDFVYAVVSRYKGRIQYYQIWNEPNIYPEWGEQPVDPEAYTELLKVGYTRAKEADPDVVIICGALASTIEVDYHPHGLNDFIFLQRMYNAGAGGYFDVLAMQGYGLWSGPTDRRMQPRVLNFSRPLYIRDIMVRNGDENKPIWLSEMNWNAVPEGFPAGAPYGQVTEEQQACYVVEAYQRIQEEWPWVGVANFWFFKRATDLEKDRPEYYFRMVEPDFTPLPVYEAMKEYANQPPVMYPGYHQEDHWAVSWLDSTAGGSNNVWQTVRDERAVLGAYRMAGGAGESLSFSFAGTELDLVVVTGPDAGQLDVFVDPLEIGDWRLEIAEEPTLSMDLRSDTPQLGVVKPVARGLDDSLHRVEIVHISRTAGAAGPVGIDGFIVRRRTRYGVGWILGGLIVVGVLLGV